MNGESNIEPILKLSSRKRWFWLFLIITLVNPIFSGLILGVSLMSEPEMKKEGKIILTTAIIWGTIVFIISGYLVKQGFFSNIK